MPPALDERRLADLYESDETAWLEITAEQVAKRQFEQLDAGNLAEYLSDMAKRDRREVVSRLRVLLAHLLKWDHQADKRTPSWKLTIANQRRDLADLVTSAVLREHAVGSLEKAYVHAVEIAAIETGLSEDSFPKNCPYSLDAALNGE
jgi:hypothetical protein